MTREIGTALAVLALYVLTMLLPLHQAAAQQRDLDALGYSTLSSWSVCAQLASDADGDPAQAAALSCPALGVAKHQLAAILPVVIGLVPVFLGEPAYDGLAQSPAPSSPPDHVGQPRAPPAFV